MSMWIEGALQKQKNAFSTLYKALVGCLIINNTVVKTPLKERYYFISLW